jgi:lysozyme
MTIAEAKALATESLRHDEGLRLHAYPDPLTGGSPWTCGYGHTGLDVNPSTFWTQAQADAALAQDVEKHTDELLAALPWVSTLDTVRAAVLINMAFNLGVPGLLAFKNTLAAVRRRDYASAAIGLRSSLWARQVHGRATRLADEMETGVRT